MSAPLAAQLEQPQHPSRQELERPGRRREGERLKAEHRLRLAGRELEVAASDEPREPAVGAAEAENQDPGVVLERLDNEEVEREALARARGAQHQRVPHLAGEQIVAVGRTPRRLEHRERLPAVRKSARDTRPCPPKGTLSALAVHGAAPAAARITPEADRTPTVSPSRRARRRGAGGRRPPPRSARGRRGAPP